MKIETKSLNVNSVISSSNIVYYHGLSTLIAPWFKRVYSSAYYVSNTGGNGNRPISSGSMKVFEDLIFVASWASEGFAVWRVNNDGTITNIYYDATPNGSYASSMSLAVDTINYLAYCGTYNVDGITEYDFSGARNGGTTVVKNTIYKIANGFDGDSPSYPYYNGLACAGEYLYYANYEVTHTAVKRFNTRTKVHSTLTVAQRTRGMNDGAVRYEPRNDRIFIMGYNDGATWIVENASTEGATAFELYPSSYSPWNRPNGAFTDNDNLNHIWTGAGYRILKLDATNALAGISNIPTYLSVGDYQYWGTLNSATPGVFFDHPERGSDQILIKPNNGWNRQGGWFDKENLQTVTIVNEGGSSNYHESLNFYEDDYGPIYRPIWTANGTKYWVVSGYSYDGNAITIYNNDPYELYDTGNLVLGGVQLSDASNIQMINMPTLDSMIYIPSSCTLNIFVSNNNGTTWEAYEPGGIGQHEFSSIGNTFRIKFEFNHSITKSAYIKGDNRLFVELIGDLPSEYPRKFGARRLTSKT